MSTKNSNIILEEIAPNKEQIRVLFDQLKQRKFNISHRYLPKYEDHEEFVKNHPYRAWFIIKKLGEIIGNIYVQFDNSIGLNCVDETTEEQIENILKILTSKLPPLEGSPSIRFGDYFLNVSASNLNLQNQLKNIGFVETQRSFYLEKNLRKS